LTKNNDAERHAYARALGNRVALEPDNNFRVIIPQHIRERIGLVGECQLIGFENYFSVWPMTAWNEFNSVPLDTNQLGPAYYDLFL
jgi:DNA-binding transcriptional regulator/RsmH inhibitor MraZ